MREEASIVAPGAKTAGRHMLNAGAVSLSRNERAQVSLCGAFRRSAGELIKDVRTDLVAAAANRWTEVDAQLRGANTTMRERLDTVLHDVRRRAAPAGMQETDRSGRVRDKDWNAVRNRHRENQTPVDGDVSVDRVNAQPTFPTRAVDNHSVAVD